LQLFETMKKILGKQVFLQKFEKSHMENPEYLSWISDEEVIRYIGRPELKDKISIEKINSYFEVINKNSNIHFFAVYRIDNKKFIGTVKINFFDQSEIRVGIADIGIMIGDKKMWGVGLGSDTLMTASHYAFKSLGARKLTAGAAVENIGVIKAFEKIGYKKEGILRNQLNYYGNYVDHILLGCFLEELCFE
jgi:ribosomal-protein-alanine N-acetyltransferase